LYYSLLWTEEQARARYLNRLQLVNALNTTLDDVQDPQVAEKKIHWWHEEIERMIAGEARHPSTKACQQDFVAGHESSTSGDSAIAGACLSLLSSVSTVRFTPPETMEQRREQLVSNFRGRLALLSHALSNEIADLAPDSHPEIAAEALAKHDLLARLPSLLHRGQPVFCTEDYKAHGISPSDLAAGVRVAAAESASAENGDELANKSTLASIPVVSEKNGTVTMLSSAIEDTHASLVKACVKPDVSERYRHTSLLPLWRIIVLRRKQLALWQKKQPNLLREQMSLTPLSKFLCAWRHRR